MDNLSEVLDRVRRIETRITRLAIALGKNPKREKLMECMSDNQISIASTDVPISLVQEFMNESGCCAMEGRVFCNNKLVAVVFPEDQ